MAQAKESQSFARIFRPHGILLEIDKKICKNSHFTYQHVAKGIIFVVPNGKRSFSKTQGSNELSPSIISLIFLKLSLLSVMPPILV